MTELLSVSSHFGLELSGVGSCKYLNYISYASAIDALYENVTGK